MEGFRRDSSGFGDLMTTSSSMYGVGSTYSAFGDAGDDDLAANPFADLASSSHLPPVQPASPQSPFQSPRQERQALVSPTVEAPQYVEPEQTPFSPPAPYSPPAPAKELSPPVSPAAYEPPPPATPIAPYERAFLREAAPEPETPAPPPPPTLQPGDPAGFSYNPYADSSFPSRFAPSSPPAPTSPTLPQSPSRQKPDLSALLGDEKPATPSFRKAERHGADALGGKGALPTSSVGRKPVAKPLAALLGLEVEEDKSASSGSSAGKEVTPTAPSQPGPAPAPSSAVKPSALETPLPPSPAPSPAPAAPASPAKPPKLSRVASEAPSTSSADSTGVNVRYESMVSPLETGDTPREDGERRNAAWPANKPVEGIDEQLAGLKIDQSAPKEATPASEEAPAASEPPASTPSASAYSQYIFSEETSTSASPEPSDLSRRPSYIDSGSRGFRAFNGSSDDGGFGAGDDADSVRGTYSRSVEVGEAEDAETETTGASTPATERTIGVGDSVRSEREGSAPLPPLPTQTPSVQGSPRSTQLGGSLGPTFIITVGDPQKVGYNPATQHTVYTVRTRTTSPAYRKNDFSVLRRYSHFVWLYEALTQNNPGVIVPGMPEKHAIGRFGSEFVENRRLGLQNALNKIVSHPMLVGDPDLRLFLESDSFDIDIKQRKIDTSADNKGLLASLSSSISGPKFVEFDDYFDLKRQQLEAFETQLRSLITALAAAAKARSTLQASVAELQSAFLALAQCDLSSSLRKLFDEAAAVQKKVYDLAEAQSVHDEQIGGLISVAESYARLCTSARGVFGARIKAYNTWQAAEANLRKIQSAHEKAKRTGRTHSELLNLSVAEISDDGGLRLVFGNQAERKMLDARHDFDDVSKLTKAEMARFEKEKVDDFKKALEDFADTMAARQREVVQVWQHYHDLLAAAVESSKAAASAPASSETAPAAS
ncbi:Vacuolar protein sorting-associated protein vps5 [Rhodotorula toruloides]|uniref:BY PROTMAP: gi/472584912/gb/EMS22487.1/ vacuolar protein sorting-associated protein VPS5 [Rhodosporidium toruloides NP11] gi/647400952/emb/CDR46828.1/ RHTO0S13e02322g1_1 [Rhodosporidium toruloides] n=1 Tax=Rhodotorula toruloides TaxID=5286 RepID=A0A0K3CVC8_RHOTO